MKKSIRIIGCLLMMSIIMSLFSVSALSESTLSLQDDRYETSPQVVKMTVSADAVNTVKGGIFGVNNGYRAGGYGIYDEESRTFNEGMLEAIKNSGITHIREPGGIEGDYFHWYETVGPVENRIPQINPFSTGYPTYTEKEGEPYHVIFGPDEWIELCNKTGIGLTIQLNAGTGTPQEAVDFIRYCLDKGVEIESIAVGNEVCMEEERVEGITVTCGPEDYILFYNEMLTLMGEEMLAELDEKGIPFGCIGLPGSHALSIHRKWDDTVLSGIHVPADFIDIHIGYSPFSVNLTDATEEQIHLTLLATHNYVSSLLKMEVKSINKVSPDTQIKMSEFGPLGNGYCYGTAGSLYLASFFQVVLNEAKVFSADYLPLCYSYTSKNTLIGANVARDEYWVNTVGHVFKMYAEMTGRSVLSTTCENSQLFKAQATGLIPRQLKVAEGDGAVYYNEETKEGSIFLINRAYKQNTAFDITLPFENAKMVKVTELWNEDYSKCNTQAEPNAVVPMEVPFQAQMENGRLTVTAKPVSLVKIDFIAE
ncbi:MAG: hypothetical protein IJD39_02215 [Clostridia bacterium]|nr:hypothetical protein [Clostridia bacterium]